MSQKHSLSTNATTAEPIELYSIATPNGIKVAACLEELSFAKGDQFSYTPYTIDIRKAENHSEAFLKLNPNGKIPVIVDPHGVDGQRAVVFESGAILLYLAEKYGELLPADPVKRVETINWLFWGSTGVSNQVKQFGFYFKYCQHSLSYCVTRYAKEVTRLLHVLEKQLSDHRSYITGDLYTIADISVWPWIYSLYHHYDGAVVVSRWNFYFRDVLTQLLVPLM